MPGLVCLRHEMYYVEEAERRLITLTCTWRLAGQSRVRHIFHLGWRKEALFGGIAASLRSIGTSVNGNSTDSRSS
jgi:hypothetical protein